MTTKLKLQLILGFAGLVIVAGALGFFLRLNVESNERTEADTAYQNQLTACRSRGNEMREYVFSLAEADAKDPDPGKQAAGRAVIYGMKHAEYSNANGTIHCQEAVKQP